MKNRLRKETENLIRLNVLERMKQLEEKGQTKNILQKQLEMEDTMNMVLNYANNHASSGIVEIVFTDKKFKSDTSISRILLNSIHKISGFNVYDPESRNTLFRTVIVIDPLWSDDIAVFESEYGMPDKFLRPKRYAQ
jgi:hypothetical protein